MSEREFTKIICMPVWYDEERNIIYFEPGECNLKKFTQARAENALFWYN